MKFKKNLFFLVAFFLLTSFLVADYKNGVIKVDASGSSINFTKITSYNGVRGGDAMEGGIYDAHGNPIKTLEDYANGKTKYITIARDTKYDGAIYKIPTITFKDSSGNTKTLTDVEARVTDTGSAFRTDLARPLYMKNNRLSYQDKNGVWKSAPEAAGFEKQFPNGMTREENEAIRATKTDIAAYIVDNKYQIKNQPSSFEKAELIPMNDKARAADKRTADLIKKADLNSTIPTSVNTTGDLSNTETIIQNAPTESIGSNLPSSSYSGSWSSEPNKCYKYAGGAGPKGLHENVMSCNSGNKCITVPTGPSNPAPYCACSPVLDCGINNIACNAPISVTGPGACEDGRLILTTAKCVANSKSCGTAGCLNYVCKKGKNAIWDPHTRKCGCDDGFAEGSVYVVGKDLRNSLDNVEKIIGTPEKPLNSIIRSPESQKIYNTAKGELGSQVCKTGLAHACANTVSGVMANSGIPFKSTDSTAVMYNNLRNDPNWKMVPLEDARKSGCAGCLIISPTEASKIGHVGIIGDSGKVMESTHGGAFKDNRYTIAKGGLWDKIFTNKGLPTYVFQYQK
ncbi:MAG: hypothetical protein WCO84_02185 [bacterium]